MKTVKKTIASALLASGLVAAVHAVTISELTSDYDVFLENDGSIAGNVHGSYAAGGDVSIISGNATINLDGNHSSEHSLVVGGSLTLDASNGKVLENGGRGTIRIGSLLAGQTIDTSDPGTTYLRQDGKSFQIDNESQSEADILSNPGIDFSGSFAKLKAVSQQLTELASTVVPSLGGDLTFDFSSAIGMQVLNLTAAELMTFGQTKSIAGLLEGVCYVINVDLTGFEGVLGSTTNHNVDRAYAGNILWNFYGDDVDTLYISSTWVGTILAPTMTVIDYSSGDIFGSVIAENFIKTGGEIHAGAFKCELPNSEVPDSGSTAALGLLGLGALLAIRRRIRQA